MPQILRRRPVVIGLAVALVFVLWLAFRPELLFVNKHVDDPFPTSSATSYRIPAQVHIATATRYFIRIA